MRPKAEWAIDSEPIRARGIIVNYFGFNGPFGGGLRNQLSTTLERIDMKIRRFN